MNLASCVGMNTLHHTCPHKTVLLAVCQKLCSINNNKEHTWEEKEGRKLCHKMTPSGL